MALVVFAAYQDVLDGLRERQTHGSARAHQDSVVACCHHNLWITLWHTDASPAYNFTHGGGGGSLTERIVAAKLVDDDNLSLSALALQRARSPQGLAITVTNGTNSW